MLTTLMGVVLLLAATAGAAPAEPPPDCGVQAVRHLLWLLTPSRHEPAGVRAAVSRSLQDLADLLKASGLPVSAVRATLDELLDTQRPALLHLAKPDHFLVLAGATPDRLRVAVVDGEGEAATLVGRETLTSRFDGYALLPELARPPRSPAAVWEAAVQRAEIAAVGGLAEFAFVVQNRGGVPLTLEVEAKDCQCVQSTVPAPVPPGGTGTVRLAYRTADLGVTTHLAVVRTNDTAQPRRFLVGEAAVTGGVVLQPPQLAVWVPFGSSWERRLSVRGPRGLAVRSVEVEPALAEVTVGARSEAHEVTTTELVVRGDPSAEVGRHEVRLVLRHNLDQGQALVVPLVLEVTSRLEVTPAALYLGQVKGPGQAVVRLTSVDGSAVRLGQVTCGDSRVALGTPRQLPGGIEIPLTVRAKPGELVDTALRLAVLEPEPRMLLVPVTAWGGKP